MSAAVFAQPIYRGYRPFHDWLHARHWPDCAALTARLPAPLRAAGLRFAPQDRALLADGHHYEQRIAGQGVIATRADNWHDLFNAMVWCTHPAIKQALNARQMAEIARMGPRQRSRAQAALTHFDEAGVIVQLRDADLLAVWDRHDWPALFGRHAQAWQDGRAAVIAVIGHALLEHALCPELFGVGKCLVVQGDAASVDGVQAVAGAIADGRVLQDPLELRPLPLAGIPGWHGRQSEADFFQCECFRPLRPGRRYPSALRPD